MTDFYILDDENNKYSVEVVISETIFHVHIYWERASVGQILCNIEPDKMLFLGNIEIFDDPVMPRNGLFSRRPFRRPHRTFYRRGLGSAMLDFLIAHAEELEVKGIYGFITPDDARKTPYLFDFYRSHGFTVNMTPGQSPATEATIYRAINRSALTHK